MYYYKNEPSNLRIIIRVQRMSSLSKAIICNVTVHKKFNKNNNQNCCIVGLHPYSDTLTTRGNNIGFEVLKGTEE
jgi:hypothetical protein